MTKEQTTKMKQIFAARPDVKFRVVETGEAVDLMAEKWPTIRIGRRGGVILVEVRSYPKADIVTISTADQLLARQVARDAKRAGVQATEVEEHLQRPKVVSPLSPREIPDSSEKAPPRERQVFILTEYLLLMIDRLERIENKFPPSREGLVKIIQRLRDIKPRVDDIAESMLTVNGLRVCVVKKGRTLRARQWNILELAWADIQDWWHKQPECKD